MSVPTWRQSGKPVNATATRRAEIERLIRSDPELQRLLSTQGAGFRLSWGDKRLLDPVKARFAALGIDKLLDPDKDSLTKDGVRDQRTFWDTYGPLILGMAGVATAGVASGAFGGGAAAGGATSAATPTLANVTAGSTAGLPGAAATLGAAPAVAGGAVPLSAAAAAENVATPIGTAAGKVGSNVLPALTTGGTSSVPFWQKALVGFGADAVKTYLSNRASGNANKDLQKGTQEAIDLYKQTFAPYLSLGSGAARDLGILMGQGGGAGAAGAPGSAAPAGLANLSGRRMPEGATPTGQAIPRPASQMGTPPLVPQQAQPSLADLSAPQQMAQAQSASSFVPMTSPDGEEGEIPFARVAEAEAAGFRRRA